jgi:hypothetical protein
MDVQKEIKIFLIVGFLVLLFYGLWLFISYESFAVMNAWPLFDPAIGRYLGATYIAWSLIVLKLLLKEVDNWERVENWVIFGTLCNILYTIGAIISLALYTLPILAVINLIINIIFSIWGIHILLQKRK